MQINADFSRTEGRRNCKSASTKKKPASSENRHATHYLRSHQREILCHKVAQNARERCPTQQPCKDAFVGDGIMFTCLLTRWRASESFGVVPSALPLVQWYTCSLSPLARYHATAPRRFFWVPQHQAHQGGDVSSGLEPVACSSEQSLMTRELALHSGTLRAPPLVITPTPPPPPCRVCTRAHRTTACHEPCRLWESSTSATTIRRCNDADDLALSHVPQTSPSPPRKNTRSESRWLALQKTRPVNQSIPAACPATHTATPHPNAESKTSEQGDEHEATRTSGIRALWFASSRMRESLWTPLCRTSLESHFPKTRTFQWVRDSWAPAWCRSGLRIHRTPERVSRRTGLIRPEEQSRSSEIEVPPRRWAEL
mmetsp:Transcript_5346/g.15261  ORF Transcript_5346/g.15261 Transcript_5346/m.15261 type:complete len:370 (+) Transcript_5346:39-1148(+)